MAKGKNKLNKTNSSGWLDDYSEESFINKYANGDKVVDPLLSPGQLAQLNKLKELSKKLPKDEEILLKQMQNKRAQDKLSVSKEKTTADKLKEAAYNPLATLTGTEKGNKFDEFIFGTPAMMANSAINTVGNVFSPSAYSAVGKGLVNMAPALTNMVLDTDYQPVFNDGSSERALEIGTDALMALPLTQLIPKSAARNLVKSGYNKIKNIEFPKQLSVSGNAVDFSKYLTQEEAVAARAERLISQKNKPGWNEQLTPELEQRLSTAVERHNPASDYAGEKLGANTMGRTATEVSKNANLKGVPLTEANKARVAAHETGHYYANSFDEGQEWLSHFNFNELPNKTRVYLRGKGNYANYGNEVRERAAQLKDYIAQKNGIPLDQDFIITQPMLDNAIKNYVKNTGLDNTMSKMLGALTDKKGLLKTMNKYALGTIPAVIGAGAASQFYNGQEEEINQYADGGKINAPIYVDNPNDPRLRKYQDSLDVYNKTSYDYNRIKNKKLASDDTPINLDSENRQSYEMWKREYNQPAGKFAVFNSGTNQNMIPKEVAHFRGSGWNFLDYVDQALFEKPVQPVILKEKSTVNTTKGKVSGKVIPNNVKGSKLIQVRKEIKPLQKETAPPIVQQNTPVVQDQPIIQQNIPIQQTIVQEQIPVKQDFRQYMQPKGYSRQGKSGERQSESFYDANGKMTGQIIEGQYVPTEYGKFLQKGSSINNDMKKKVKKYPAGGYLDYQEGFKGFGVGPQLYQDNSYFRSIMPDTIENMEEEINQPSVFSGINDVLGAVNQGVSQVTGLMSQFSQPTMKGNNVMPDISNWQSPLSSGKTDEQLNFENDQKLKQAGLFNYFYPNQNTTTGSTMGPSINSSTWKGVPFMKNGGYLKKYQDGGNMDMLPVGYPEYIHKSNVFHENYNPVPRVHFSDDTTPYDMGVNLNDLVNMYGGRVGKYQYGGMMPFYSRQRSPRVFNSNANRASAADLQAAYANDFMHTKVKKDRQSFEDDKVDWGALNFLKEPTGAVLGTLSAVPIVGDITQSALGDSFLTRTGGYTVGRGIGNVGMGAAKVIGGAATGNVGMIGSGIGDVGEGVGSTVGTFQAKDALSNYDKSGYVSGNRMVNASQDFGNMMDTASGLFGNIKGGVGMVKNMGGLKGMMGNMKGGATGMKGFGNIMGKITGFGQDGGYIDYNFNDIEQYKYGGKISQKINKKQNKTGWLDQL